MELRLSTLMMLLFEKTLTKVPIRIQKHLLNDKTVIRIKKESLKTFSLVSEIISIPKMRRNVKLKSKNKLNASNQTYCWRFQVLVLFLNQENQVIPRILMKKQNRMSKNQKIINLKINSLRLKTKRINSFHLLMIKVTKLMMKQN